MNNFLKVGQTLVFTRALAVCAAFAGSAGALAQELAPTEAPAKPLALQAAEDYAQQARYPEWSQALARGAADPLIEDRTPTRQYGRGPNGADPRLTVWASAVSARPGEAITLYATLANVKKASPLPLGNLAKAPALGGAKVTGEIVTYRGDSIGTVAYLDGGIAPDAKAGDGIYTARYPLPAAYAPALGQADSLMVKVEAVLADGEVRHAAGGFVFSNPSARLTGAFQDRAKNGNLVIAAEVEVLAPGRVHLAGTLADAAGRPFATAQTANDLQPGKHWMNLPFYGLAFHDRGLAGAFRLASVSLTSTQGMPNALGPVLTDAHTTAPYALAQLSDKPFGRPDLVDAARRLKADALGAPASPGNPDDR